MYILATITPIVLGVDVAMTLPFGKDKWILFIEPTYQSINQTGNTTFLGQQQTAALNYEWLSLPLDVRYRSFLGSQTRFFAAIGFAINFDLTSEVNYELSNNLDSPTIFAE